MQLKFLICLLLMQCSSLFAGTSHPHDSLSTSRERVVFNTAEYEAFDLTQANDENIRQTCFNSYQIEDVYESFYTPNLAQNNLPLEILVSNISDSLNLFIEVFQGDSTYLNCFRIGHEERLISLDLPADSTLFHVRYFTLSPDSIQGRSFQTAYISDFGIQRCPPGSIGGQDGIDSFAVDYPYCDVYGGDLVLEDEIGNNIYNLHGLSHINRVEGDLIIGYCEHLRNLEGLENLKSVSKTLSISWTNLTSIEQMTSLEQVKSFQIFGNNSLVDVYLPKLTQITGRITVYGNNNLLSLGMLSNVKNIGQNLIVTWNENLQTLDGLDSLERVGADLLIEYNTNLSDISGLSNLEHVGNAFTLSQISTITDLTGLSSLTTVEGAFYLAFLYDLQSLNGLQNVHELGHNLTISNNGDLFILEGLNNLTAINGALLIEENNSLADLDALSNLQSLNNYLHIIENPSLWSIIGLAQVDPETILSTSPSNEDLIIEGNSALAVCDQEPLCSFLQQTNINFTIRQNAGRCSDFKYILDDCANSILPIEFSNFNVKAIDKEAHLHWTTASETNNKGFAIERTLDGDIWNELSFIEGQGTSSSEQHYTFIDEDITSGTYYYRLKQIDFDGNTNYSTIERASFELVSGDAYPNPVSNRLYINAKSAQSYMITDIRGRLVLTSSEPSIDLSQLSNGIYLLKVNGHIQKILKH